jgi:hypothetical protein
LLTRGLVVTLGNRPRPYADRGNAGGDGFARSEEQLAQLNGATFRQSRWDAVHREDGAVLN